MKKALSSLFSIFALYFYLLPSFLFSQTVEKFETPGTFTWIVPPCVTSITVQAWAGGGGGGGAASNQNQSNDEACSQGGGGGGGGFVSRTYTVIPGESYTVIVGAGGIAGLAGTVSAVGNNGGIGGNSSFSGPATATPGMLTAFGGLAGGGAWSKNTSNGFTSHVGFDGLGGAGSGGANGTTTFFGGNGSAGVHSASCYDVSGAGGGGAGTSANGGNASAPAACNLRVGGTGGATDGGTGANGQKLTSYAASREFKVGLDGTILASGGGGAMIHLHSWPNQWTKVIGGTGARGEVRIIYTPTGNVAAQPSQISGSPTIPCGGGSNSYSVINVAGVTYVWTYSGTGTITGTGNAIMLDASTAGTLTVTPTADCQGPPQTFNITLQSLVAGTASISNSTFCGTGNTSLSLTGYSGNIQWQQSTNNGASWSNISGATSTPFLVTGITGNTIFRAVISGTGCTSVNSNTVSITQTPNVTPTVTITGNPASICAGSTINFTANPNNGGTNPTYQWQLNGTNIIGATNATFSSNSLNENDQISVILTSNAPCISSPTATVSVQIVVNPNSVPSVAITGAPTSPLCPGTSVTFTANPTNGGTNPTYQWQINGVNVNGETGVTFTASTFNNNDAITVVMTSNNSCANPLTATSPNAIVQIGGNLIPSVAISGAPTSPLCPGTSVTFTANPTNGVTNPTYQWQINGVNVNGETGVTFTASTFNNNDAISVVMTSNNPCANPLTAISPNAIVQIGGNLIPSVAITGAPTSPLCPGTSVTFTANPTNGGTNPTYQWQINGVNVNGETGVTFTASTFNNNDAITVVMTSNNPCANPLTATATTNPITVLVPLTPTISVTYVADECLDSPTVFTANTTNAGSAPTYQWILNGNVITSAVNPTFESLHINENDTITILLTSNAYCLTSNLASFQLVAHLGQNTSNIDFEFPNVITANGDGINEILDLDQLFSSCTEYQFLLLNRWGNVVYEQKRGESPFSGKDKSGGILGEGVYFYKVNYNQQEKIGFITIVR